MRARILWEDTHIVNSLTVQGIAHFYEENDYTEHQPSPEWRPSCVHYQHMYTYQPVARAYLARAQLATNQKVSTRKNAACGSTTPQYRLAYNSTAMEEWKLHNCRLKLQHSTAQCHVTTPTSEQKKLRPPPQWKIINTSKAPFTSYLKTSWRCATTAGIVEKWALQQCVHHTTRTAASSRPHYQQEVIATGPPPAVTYQQIITKRRIKTAQISKTGGKIQCLELPNFMAICAYYFRSTDITHYRYILWVKI